MRNITLSADEQLIDAARDKARLSKSTLNAEFRKWLKQYTSSDASIKNRITNYRNLMSDLSEVTAPKIKNVKNLKNNRGKMNER